MTIIYAAHNLTMNRRHFAGSRDFARSGIPPRNDPSDIEGDLF
ncbi:hypothetical protein [Rhizobium sp. Leaf383]|nr:hypothetical protein [Rhizobium sp. Leaf383]